MLIATISLEDRAPATSDASSLFPEMGVKKRNRLVQSGFRYSPGSEPSDDLGRRFKSRNDLFAHWSISRDTVQLQHWSHPLSLSPSSTGVRVLASAAMIGRSAASTPKRFSKNIHVKMIQTNFITNLI